MNRLTNGDRCRVLACLVEGNSIRSTVRITGIAKRTVSRLLIELGQACERFADGAMRNLSCQSIRCDEIWAFVGAKEKNATDEQKRQGWGDVWTYVAIDPVTKLIPQWWIGDRSAESAYRFMLRLSRRLANRVQLTTDGLKAYLIAVKAAFPDGIDYAQLVKLYDSPLTGRYSPAAFAGSRKEKISGSPFPEVISTSHVERQNLTVRMECRRFTRLTNAFSKSIDNHRLACAIHFVHYNFARMHQSLRCTPAMAAGLSDHVWELAEIVKLLEAEELALAA
jgi:IS1 family transposase